MLLSSSESSRLRFLAKAIDKESPIDTGNSSVFMSRVSFVSEELVEFAMILETLSYLPVSTDWTPKMSSNRVLDMICKCV
ncbi:hypothetical protein OGAPHI_002752 [Ogataea philodendri]|uniref:Uncharacterized protein n=1 Tax=Ogataea philodendri TaxID=1378263 RepID=A0A9P8PCY0_9ASCO|nr:uncharacterized protein OGAPHI_002752 [Ogataea philodendri]KAH3668997.1 hypothetical protein OGAPHI_002752 [Ogataea philodendri]